MLTLTHTQFHIPALPARPRAGREGSGSPFAFESAPTPVRASAFEPVSPVSEFDFEGAEAEAQADTERGLPPEWQPRWYSGITARLQG